MMAHPGLDDFLRALLYQTKLPDIPGAEGPWRLILLELSPEVEEAPAKFYADLQKFPGLLATATHDVHMLLLMRECEGIEDLAGTYALSGARGNEFCDLRDAATHYAFLRHVLALGKRLRGENALYHAEDFGSYLYFLQIAQGVHLPLFHADEVLQVMEHDYENTTRLSQSLFMYLSSFQNIKEAAAELSIHRNTMEYQIRKIEAILGSDMPGDDRLFEMLCTFIMLVIDGIL